MSNFLEDTKKKLDSVSTCFCLAKWTSVTMHLESGTTHSCHHPQVHHVPLLELERTPAALHNTQYKIQQRKKMIAGERPKECEYCWKIEDLQADVYSDRILKSAAEWSLGEYKRILENSTSVFFKPKYVEVSFSNTCQFKCSYCSANYSTTWEAELNKFGSYPTNSGKKDVETFDEGNNPYIKAFWTWWPELKQGLHTFRITGGEPLLSPNTFRVIESLIESPEPDLTLAINSNLGVPDVLMNKFLKYAGRLLEVDAVKKLEIFTSIDAYGERAEYIRNGLKHNIFWRNVERILESNENLSVYIMCTFNALSVTSFVELLEKIKTLNHKHQNPKRALPIFIDISYLRYPDYQSVQVLPKKFTSEVQKIVEFVEENQKVANSENSRGFLHVESIKIKRILQLMQQEVSLETEKRLRSRFYAFFAEHDRRRGTDFISVFPEMKDFWKDCQKCYWQDSLYNSLILMRNIVKDFIRRKIAKYKIY